MTDNAATIRRLTCLNPPGDVVQPVPQLLISFVSLPQLDSLSAGHRLVIVEYDNVQQHFGHCNTRWYALLKSNRAHYSHTSTFDNNARQIENGESNSLHIYTWRWRWVWLRDWSWRDRGDHFVDEVDQENCAHDRGPGEPRRNKFTWLFPHTVQQDAVEGCVCHSNHQASIVGYHLTG